MISLSDLEVLKSGNAQEFIANHIDDDPDALALSARQPGIPLRACIEQIVCRRKAKAKLPRLSSLPLLYEQTALEQASHEAASRYKATILCGKSLVDLTGGLGIDSLILAENFDKVDYLEKEPERCNLFKVNIATAAMKNIDIHCTGSLEYLERAADSSWDWIYADPSRRSSGGRHVSLAACSPDLSDKQDLLLAKAACVCIKVSPAFDLAKARALFSQLQQIHVVSVGGECKEILLILSRAQPDRLSVTAAVLAATGEIIFSTSGDLSLEHSGTRVTGPVGRYFIDPDPAIVKADLTSATARQFGCRSLSNHTHYLTTDTAPVNFPGRLFSVVATMNWNRKSVKRYCIEHHISGAAIARRDFPVSPEQLRKMLNIGESSEDFLFFTPLENGTPACIHCRYLSPQVG